jgi:hypothetical protein
MNPLAAIPAKESVVIGIVPSFETIVAIILNDGQMMDNGCESRGSVADDVGEKNGRFVYRISNKEKGMMNVEVNIAPAPGRMKKEERSTKALGYTHLPNHVR